jgi:ketosteroid isomerase-like protein
MVKVFHCSIIFLATFYLLSGCTNPDTAMSNLEIVKSTYEGRTSEENGQNLAKHVAGDVRWIEAQGFPYAGTYVGIDAISKNVFSRLASEWIDYRVTMEDYIACDNRVVAYGTYSGIYKATGKSFTARVAHLWKLENSKIVSFEQIVDSKPVQDAMIQYDHNSNLY